ncbi:MAG: DNA adenine methylase [Bacteroidota bacterium]
MHRLENTCIENMDALELIKSRDAETSFFYLDPPYISESIGSKQGKGNKVDQ